jgi:dUTPase
VNRTEGAKPVINTVFDEVTRVYDEITGTDLFSIAGNDLAPDGTKEDEYVALASTLGVETKCEIEFSDIQNVKARLVAALPPGTYTLKVYTRSGLGDEFGVHVATRKVVVA